MTWFVRWGIGLLTVVAGVACLILNLGGFGIEELFGFTGAGLSIILINFLFRLGLEGDREREAHERDWRYFETHGHWPDEAPPERHQPPPERHQAPPERAAARTSGHRRSGHRPDRARRRPD